MHFVTFKFGPHVQCLKFQSLHFNMSLYNGAGLPYSTIVSSLGLLLSRFSTTSPDGGCAGFVVVVAQDMWWAGAGGNKIKANSAQLS
jgi:hypothetical protein